VNRLAMQLVSDSAHLGANLVDEPFRLVTRDLDLIVVALAPHPAPLVLSRSAQAVFRRSFLAA